MRLKKLVQNQNQPQSDPQKVARFKRLQSKGLLVARVTDMLTRRGVFDRHEAQRQEAAERRERER